MFRILRQFLLVLISFAFLGGTTQLAWSEHRTPTTMMAGMPCDMTMSMAGDGHDKPATPCKTMMPDCLKHISIGADGSLPSRFVGSEVAVHLSAVDYWTPLSRLDGLTGAPEPLPPRTI